MILGHRHFDADDDRPGPQIGLVLPFGVRRPESISPDGEWETVARIPAIRPVRPSDEPTLELPAVRLDGAPPGGPVLAPIVYEDPRVRGVVADGRDATAGRPLLVPVPGPEHVVGLTGGRGAGRRRVSRVRDRSANPTAGRRGVARGGSVRGDVRGLLATLVETVLELLVTLVRLLIDGVRAIYWIVQRFGTAAVIVSMVLLGLRMIPWAEIAAFMRSLSAPP